MKSSCCGAEASRSFGESDDLHCLMCLKKCRAIKDDIMSKKEILKFCDSYLEIDIYYLEKHLKEIMHKENLLEFRQALKSVKEHLK